MPSKRSPMARGRRSLRGGSKVWNWLKKAAGTVHRFVKDNKLISRGGKFVRGLGIVPPQYAGALDKGIQVAGTLGYGRRKMRMGYGVRLAGGALRLAGARRY